MSASHPIADYWRECVIDQQWANSGRRASPIQALMSLIGAPRRLLVCVRVIRVGVALGPTTRCRRLTLSQSTIATPNGSAVYGGDLHANGITRIVGLSLYCGGGQHHSHHEDRHDQCAHLSLHYVRPHGALSTFRSGSGCLDLGQASRGRDANPYSCTKQPRFGRQCPLRVKADIPRFWPCRPGRGKLTSDFTNS
jgi:hypothetical protein